MSDKIKEYWIYFQHGNHIILTEPPINKPHYVHVIEYRAWQAALQGMNDMARIDVFAENERLRHALKQIESEAVRHYGPEFEIVKMARRALDNNK